MLNRFKNEQTCSLHPDLLTVFSLGLVIKYGERGAGGGGYTMGGGERQVKFKCNELRKVEGSFSHAESGEHKMFRCSYTEPCSGQRVVVGGGGGTKRSVQFKRGHETFYPVWRGSAYSFTFSPATVPFCSPLPVINDRSVL